MSSADKVFGVFMLIVIAAFSGSCTTASYLHDRAIQNSCAHYDTKTGVYTWNDEDKKP